MNYAADSVKNSQQDRSTFVTGSAGFVGKHLIRALARSGHSVVAVYRTRMPESLQNVFPVCSDLSNIDILKIPLRGVNSVVHAAWDSVFSRQGNTDQPETFHDSENIKALKNLIQAMEVAKTKRLIFLSVMGARPDDVSYFKREKYWAEHLILNSSIPEKVIIRTPMVIGPLESDYFLYKSVKDTLKIPLIAPTPNYPQSIRPIHVDDLVATLIMLISKPLEQACLVSDLEGGEAFSCEQLVRMMQQVVDKRKRLQVKGSLAKFFMSLTELASGANNPRPLLSQRLNAAFINKEQSQVGNVISGLLHQQKFTSIREDVRSA